MDLKIFFSPIEEQVYLDIPTYNCFINSINIYGEKMPDYHGADIALIGLQEEGSHLSYAADHIRKKLYRLKSGKSRYKIIDLGNLRSGMNLQESYLRIKEVCAILISENVLPVLIGGSHDLDYGQFQAYEDLEKLISIINVDALFDMEDNKGEEVQHQHIHNILVHEPNYLFNYSHLAYQSYLVDPDEVSTLERLYFDTYRLGDIRRDLQEMEPVIRNADMMSFDISAIKSSDAPGTTNPQPFGLTGEEACQICWYAGLNEKLSSAGFYNYNVAMDDSQKKTASVVATMIWYFVEGFYNRKNEKHFKSNDYLKYVVSLPYDPATMVFYKSKISEKWWLEVPYPEGKKDRGKIHDTYSRNCIVPCSYTDYLAANNGELPERWIATHAKLF
ncbi:MAG: formimidoylglutamase [Bacteroidota bacterium]|nr:formimidoylglutamase [Bacteroidota bacterium]